MPVQFDENVNEVNVEEDIDQIVHNVKIMNVD
jgi:hypothetical protein